MFAEAAARPRDPPRRPGRRHRRQPGRDPADLYLDNLLMGTYVLDEARAATRRRR